MSKKELLVLEDRDMGDGQAKTTMSTLGTETVRKQQSQNENLHLLTPKPKVFVGQSNLIDVSLFSYFISRY